MKKGMAVFLSVECSVDREARRQEYLSMAVAAEKEAAKTGDPQIRRRWLKLVETYRELAQMS